ncbi:MAG: hypothetical protein CMM53_06255 [Rhodospirillaceae bacterium]|nr:hypothetical protein [Rhodospirillaceae bacterium]
MRKFVIGSLVLAGFPSVSDATLPEEIYLSTNDDGPTLLAEKILPFTLAGHRSHSSHRSHGSHRSHRSSGGGIYTPSFPSPPINRNRNSTPPESVLPRSPIITLPKIRGNSKAFLSLARRVQMLLMAFGFYTGALDGVIGVDTRNAILRYQASRGLKLTGKIDDDLIKSMNIPLDIYAK